MRNAEQCLQLDDLIHREIADPSGIDESLCIGASETVVQTWLPSLITARFRLVAAGLGVGALPAALARPEIDAGRLGEFDPGWQPNALGFTASYLSEPESFVVERAAAIAREIAQKACDQIS